MIKISLHIGQNELELVDRLVKEFAKRDYQLEQAIDSAFENLLEKYDYYLFLLSENDSIKESELFLKQVNEITLFNQKKSSDKQVYFVIKGNYQIPKVVKQFPYINLDDAKPLEDVLLFIKNINKEKSLNKIKLKYEKKNFVYELTNRVIIIKIPAGRDTFECQFRLNEDELSILENSQIDCFNFILGFEGIWSKELKTIECEIQTDFSPFLPRIIYNYLKIEKNKEEEIENQTDEKEDIPKTIELPFIKDIKVEIGESSQELTAMLFTRDIHPMQMFLRNRRFQSIKISNIIVTKHDDAVELLQKIANSIFFQIDMVIETPIFLRTQRERYSERRRQEMRRKSSIDKDTKISCPKFEYEHEPMSLFWYAKSNTDKPLFQYLSYYQVVEYYFPRYSSVDAKRRIQNYIKSPKFDPDRDIDISKILDLVKVTGGGKTFGNEREQLKATLKGLIDNEDLRNFFELDVERKEFYEKNETKGFIKQRITLSNQNADLIQEVTERIYEIRCKIVHSKSGDDEFDIILPYSFNVRKLTFDLELVEFIARKLLIANSQNLTI